MALAEERGGGEVMLRQLVEQGRGLGVQWVVVFLEDGPMVSAFRHLGAKAVVIEAGRLRQPHRICVTVARIARVAQREQATLILGWMMKGQVYGAPAAVLSRRPAVWYQIAIPQPRDWLARLATALPARGVITLSRAGASAQAAIRPARRQLMVYPGVELERFAGAGLPAPAVLRARFGLPPDGPLIGIVSRLQRWKGIHVLIDAMALLRRTHPQAKCVVVGGTHELEIAYANELRRQVAALGLQSHVTFTGLKRNIHEWMHAMDVVVHASDREPFGIVVIEAMALGKPLIAGSEGGPREIVTDGVDGLLVAYGDAAGLAAALRRYLADPDFATTIGLAARRRAADFSAKGYAENVIKALEELRRPV